MGRINQKLDQVRTAAESLASYINQNGDQSNPFLVKKQAEVINHRAGILLEEIPRLTEKVALEVTR